MRIWLISELLLLLIVANGTPVIIGLLLGQRCNQPLDAGRLFPDQRPWLGASKTIRGVLAAISASTLCAPLVGFTYIHGALFGGLSMLGDLLSSFIKRRLGFSSSCSRPVLDQLPETLLPLLVMQPVHTATVPEMAVVITVFIVVDLLLSRVINPRQATCKR
jgi:CDP-2,3-bis-(O-geranylgeranyl)-sn-glycerol synthase